MIIKRTLEPTLLTLAQQFPIIAIMGPRQSGKTTLSKSSFPSYTYINFENLILREAALRDPYNFLLSYENSPGLILDEVQEVPALFSYLQLIVDEREYRPGHFILTGSQNFLLHEQISQTLAGRITLLTLLPLSISEIKTAYPLPNNTEPQILKGFYPRLYSQNIPFSPWYEDYISTYIEKDVRQVLKITDIIAFQRFLKLCAARVGNIINYSDLARDADISPNTAKAWLSVLESSYIIKLLHPYHHNFNKRIIKSPKLYFYDTGIVCTLLGIKTAEDLNLHPFRGAIFESFVISECFKAAYHNKIAPHFYFWRDVQGHEIDIIIEKSITQSYALEIKAGMNINESYFKGIVQWHDITKQISTASYIIYGGNDSLIQHNIRITSWKQIDELIIQLISTPK